MDGWMDGWMDGYCESAKIETAISTDLNPLHAGYFCMPFFVLVEVLRLSQQLWSCRDGFSCLTFQK